MSQLKLCVAWQNSGSEKENVSEKIKVRRNFENYIY